MNIKNQRLMAVQDIIKHKRVSSQQELLDLLREKGIGSAQATLCRDLRRLKAGKIADAEKGYVYTLNGTMSIEKPKKHATNLLEAFSSLKFNGHLGVIKTTPAFAACIATLLDNLNFHGVLGIVAGRDSILVILKEGVSPTDFKQSLLLSIPELKEKL